MFETPIAEIVKDAIFESMNPPFVARSAMNINGTKKPIIVRNPLVANSINDGDFNSDMSNIVANVRRTASGHSLQEASSS